MRFRFPFFKSLFPSLSWTARPRPKTRRVHLAVEQLEDRIALSTTAYTPIGPNQITGISDGGTVSGRITAIATDPNPADTSGNIVYVGSAGGGVWQGTNIHTNNPTWTPLTDNLAAQINDPLVTLSVGAITTTWDSTTGSTIIYAGLGEANAETNLMSPGAAASQFYGAGIIKSIDGGQTWTLLGGNGASNIFYRSAISKIVINPTSQNIVYAAVATAKNGVTGNEGIWESTNGGVSWTNTTATAIPGSNQDMFSDLVMDPSNPSVLYAAVGEPAGSAANGVYITTNGGGTWQPMTSTSSTPFLSGPTVGRITLAISPTSTGADVLYAAFMTTKTSPDATIGTLYQLGYAVVNSSSPSASVAYNVIKGFNQPTTGSIYDYVGTQGYYGTSLIVAPDNAYTIYAGGQDNFLSITGANTASPGVTDLAALHSQAGTRIHVDHHGIAIDPNPAAGVGKYSVLDGNDGGAYEYYPNKTSGGTYDWSDLNTNLAITQMYGLAANPNNPSQIYGAAQDNGNFWTSKGNLTWNSVTAGDGSEVYIDPTSNPEKVFVTQTASLYTNSIGTNPFSLTKLVPVGGGTPGKPNGIPGDFPAPAYQMQVVNGSDYLWYGGEDTSGGVHTGSSALWLSTDGGATAGNWHEIGVPGQNGWPLTQKVFDNGFQVENTAVDSIGVSATNPNLVYVGLRGGEILVTNDGTNTSGATWTVLNPPVSLTSTTIAAASNGQTLPQGTINVASTAGFPTSGSLFIETASGTTTLVTYTGTTATSFTGCSGGLSGTAPAYTLATGDKVTFQNDLRYSDILVDPSNPNIAYVTAANFGDVTGGGHVWMTTNAGQTWTNISGNLPDVPAWSLQLQDAGPGAPPVLYVGTDVGVFVSTNGGTSWSSFGSGLPNVQVRTMNLLVNPQFPTQSQLLVGTFGRGAFEIAPAATASTFVASIYLQLLNRPADSGGLNYWTGVLNALGNTAADRTQVVADIETSSEYRFVEVNYLYLQYLRRSALNDPGAQSWVNFLGNGGTVEQAAAQIAGSPEFIQGQTDGTIGSWLNVFYQDALHRSVDSSGLAYWSAVFAAGSSRAQIAENIFTLPGSPANEYRIDLVDTYYIQFLGRSGVGDPGSLYWASLLQQGVPDQAVIAGILGSQEFYNDSV